MLTYVLLIVGLSNLILGCFVWFKNPNKNLNKYFGIFAIFTGFWVISNFLLQYFINIELLKLIYLLGIFLVLFAIIWSYYLIKDKSSSKFRVFMWVIFFINIIFSYFMFSTDLFISSIKSAIDYQTGSLFIVFGSYMLILLFGYFIFLIYLYKKSSHEKKNQFKYVIFGLFVFIITSAIVSFIIPSITGSTKYNFLDSVSSFAFVSLSTYSILAHHLFDIRVIIKKTLIYSVLLAFVLSTFALFIFFFAALFGTGNTQFTWQSVVPNIIAAVIVAIGFEPLKQLLTDTTDKFLFKGEYDSQKLLNRMSQILSSVLDLDEGLRNVIDTLCREMRLERAAAFVLTKDPDKDELIVKRSKSIGYPDEKITLEKDHIIAYFEKYIQAQKIRYSRMLPRFIEEPDEEFKKTKLKYAELPHIESRPILVDELEKIVELSSATDPIVRNTLDELKRLQAAIAIPVIVKGNLIGIFILGNKKSGDIYTDNDIQLLDVIANQTASAIEKARFYEEDQLKSEFVSIASHELLTPTSAIEGYLSMILDEGMGKVDEQAKKYLDKVYMSSKRLAHLVKDLLNVSRIEGGRIVIQSANFDIGKLIETVASEMMPKAKEKNLELIVEGIDRELPQVWADQDRVHQALVNLIGNSIKYTQTGSVKVRADYSLSVIRVSVIDTGVGIPADEIPHLFEKFYRASNADAHGAQGTGLGLYITKNMIELMGGIIQVDSELGKGSVFSFSLPRAKENISQKK